MNIAVKESFTNIILSVKFSNVLFKKLPSNTTVQDSFLFKKSVSLNLTDNTFLSPFCQF